MIKVPCLEVFDIGCIVSQAVMFSVKIDSLQFGRRVQLRSHHGICEGRIQRVELNYVNSKQYCIFPSRMHLGTGKKLVQSLAYRASCCR